MSRTRFNYIESGYCTSDGLGDGHWITGPGGIQRWHGDLDTLTNRTCPECDRPLGPRAKLCNTCNQRRLDRSKRAGLVS